MGSFFYHSLVLFSCDERGLSPYLGEVLFLCISLISVVVMVTGGGGDWYTPVCGRHGLLTLSRNDMDVAFMNNLFSFS